MHRVAACFVHFFLPLLYVMTACHVVFNGHLHEDAYILFQYVRNINELGVISFDRVSGPAEGATDFLWMLMLSGLRFLGADPAFAAGALNLAGLFVILLFVGYLAGKRLHLFALLSALVLFSGGTAAALGGFSALAYGGIFSGMLWCALERRTSALIALCLVLALFRPDGVLISLGTFLAYCVHNRQIFSRKDVVALAGATISAVAYFCWRYHYFGLPLPLPLLVKSATDQTLQGLRPNVEALIRYFPLFAIGIAAVISDKEKRARACYFLCGPALLFVFLMFSFQSQNVGNRFQFLIVLSVIFLAALSQRRAWPLLFLAAIPPLMGGVELNRDNVRYLTNNDYINAFPQSLRIFGFKSENIAITEAGRMPYFYNAGMMTDLVGLNTKAVVVNGAYSSLCERHPDLIFVHHAGRYAFNGLLSSSDAVKYSALPLSAISLRAYAGSNPIYLAPEAALNFARKNNYRAYVAKYPTNGDRFDHVYFLRPGTDERAFVKAMDFALHHRIPYNQSM